MYRICKFKIDWTIIETTSDHELCQVHDQNSLEWLVVIAPTDNYAYKIFGAFRDMV